MVNSLENVSVEYFRTVASKCESFEPSHFDVAVRDTEFYRLEILKTYTSNGYQVRTCDAKFDSPLCQLFMPSNNPSLIQARQLSHRAIIICMPWQWQIILVPSASDILQDITLISLSKWRQEINYVKGCVNKNQLDAQLILSIFRQPLHVSSVSRLIIRRYNSMYTTIGTYYSC